jgi:hypothetical protein
MTASRLAAFSSVALALTLASPSPALGQGADSGAMAPPPAAAPTPASSARPAVPEDPVHFVLTMGADFGSTKLVEATMSDGSTRSLKANQGFNAGAGASFLHLADNVFATQATIGFEYSAISATNGSIRWLAYPLEVMEFAYLDPVRLGAGLSYLLSPSVKGDGAATGLDVKFKSSAGLVFQADAVYRFKQSPRAGRMTVGIRYVVQSLEADLPGAQKINANAFGIAMNFLL